MAIQLQKGLFDVAIAVLDATTEAPGTTIHNFYPRSLSATYQNDSSSIDGGDARLEDNQFNERYELSLETAGLPMAALAALEGVTLATSGSGSTLVTTLTKNVTSNVRPYVRLRAQQKDKSGGATTYFFWRTTLSGSPTLNMAQGEYSTPTLPLIATPATVVVAGPPAVAVNDLFAFEVKATYAALS
jgi:hypothetical protein